MPVFLLLLQMFPLALGEMLYPTLWCAEELAQLDSGTSPNPEPHRLLKFPWFQLCMISWFSSLVDSMRVLMPDRSFRGQVLKDKYPYGIVLLTLT